MGFGIFIFHLGAGLHQGPDHPRVARLRSIGQGGVAVLIVGLRGSLKGSLRITLRGMGFRRGIMGVSYRLLYGVLWGFSIDYYKGYYGGLV